MLKYYLDGSVVHELHFHHGPEGAGFARTATRLAEPLAEVIKERLGHLRWSGSDEARAFALAGIGEERELGDGEDLTSDLSHAQVHLPGFVAYNPQTRDLVGEPVGLGLPVALSDPDEQQEAGTYLGDPLVTDRNIGLLYPLEDYPHGA